MTWAVIVLNIIKQKWEQELMISPEFREEIQETNHETRAEVLQSVEKDISTSSSRTITWQDLKFRETPRMRTWFKESQRQWWDSVERFRDRQAATGTAATPMRSLSARSKDARGTKTSMSVSSSQTMRRIKGESKSYSTNLSSRRGLLKLTSNLPRDPILMMILREIGFWNEYQQYNILTL